MGRQSGNRLPSFCLFFEGELGELQQERLIAHRIEVHRNTGAVVGTRQSGNYPFAEAVVHDAGANRQFPSSIRQGRLALQSL